MGFANFLLRLYETEKPRAVLVGWDSLDEPTYRHEALEGYQSGRTFDDELVDQFEVLPEFIAACGFANAKQGGFEADDFLAAAAGKEEKSGDRDQLASDRTTILQPIRAGEMARIGLLKCEHATVSIPRKCQTSSRCAATRRIEFQEPQASDL